jgi:predicted RNA-binding protein with RPS1 domain
MLALEITINGELHCVVGIGDHGVFGTNLQWVKRSEDVVRDGALEEELYLQAGGLRTVEEDTDEYLTWLHHNLTIGDEVTVKVIETDAVSEPMSLRRETPEDKERAIREYLKEFEGEPFTTDE